GKQAAEVGYDEAAMVVRVAGAPALSWVAAGLDDGRVWACDLTGQKIVPLKAEKGAPVTALAITPDAKRVAWGCEDGAAGVAEVEN
ncbi:MAG TPA: WD40 repeat domain-containing protein, partial [Phenylobacterium sp.]|nr:WD40 repeat domain-containing protein [Phenylobacterium sp.]